MLSQTIDITEAFVAGAGYVIDASGWDKLVVQFVAPSGTINITATNDGGAVQGTSDGGAATATNFTAVQATKLADGTAVTAVAAAGLYRVDVVGRYVKFGGSGATATKVIVEYCKLK